MAVQELRIYLNNQPAEQSHLAMFNEIRVDQAIGMAAEAELHMLVRADGAGVWAGVEDEFVQPFSRVRIEVRVRDGDYIALIDGPVIAQRFELDASPGRSKIVIVAQDDSVLLNRDEEVVLYEDKAAHEIANELFAKFGLGAETDAVSMPAGGLERITVQRGTAMQLLRELARANGMFVYVKPGDVPAASIGIFKSAEPDDPGWPELQMMGKHRNINSFQAQFDGLRPLKARADSINIFDMSLLSSETKSSEIDAQGDMAVHDMVEAGQVLLARTRERQEDIQEATQAAVDYSSWAYTANAEVAADTYAAVLMPHHTVSVSGVGGYLSGSWLISQVSHTIDLKKGARSYTQNFTLRRNARSNGVGESASSSGEVF